MIDGVFSMNLFAIIINSEIYYFTDAINTAKNSTINEYISTYQIPSDIDSDNVFNSLLEDIMRDLNAVLKPVKLIDIYRT